MYKYTAGGAGEGCETRGGRTEQSSCKVSRAGGVEHWGVTDGAGGGRGGSLEQGCNAEHTLTPDKNGPLNAETRPDPPTDLLRPI